MIDDSNDRDMLLSRIKCNIGSEGLYQIFRSMTLLS